MKNQWRVVSGLVLVLIVVIFAVLNNQTVPVSFGFVEISGPLILIILGSAILGALIGLLTSTTTMWKQKKQVKELEKSIEIYKNDADKLTQEEVEKVKRTYENQLAELQAKYDAATSSATVVTDTEPVGSRVDHFTKPRSNNEEI
ncbi:LapA family protein [Candidatus Enterococcus ikei]|uniref:LapA family protein n=1 Tax=Candidatus Enterococcus ikei TaxID=2815326 RepID=A0ABS3H195_9ENTE|nr:LapA family protein [Enterococcus sp. DIV0869a]MBO0441302.1 LapA family protein [Enterococcus sp. DIV0869a]